MDDDRDTDFNYLTMTAFRVYIVFRVWGEEIISETALLLLHIFNDFNTNKINQV